MLAMFAMIFLIFFSKATMILDKWHTVLLLLVPNALFIALTIAVLTWLNKRLGLSYEENMAVVFSSTGKNNGTAIAIASMAFSPLVAIPAATMPIFQILPMVLYLKIGRLGLSLLPLRGQDADAKAGSLPPPRSGWKSKFVFSLWQSSRYEVDARVVAPGKAVVTSKEGDNRLRRLGRSVAGASRPGRSAGGGVCGLHTQERGALLHMLPFRHWAASIHVEADRDEPPPRIARIRYELRLVTDEKPERVELLRRNLVKYGTVYNTLAPACEISGAIVGEAPAAEGKENQ